MKVLDYIVITDSHKPFFIETILKYLHKGWDLQGGVSSYRHDEYLNNYLHDSYPMYSQALVKYEKE